MPANLDSLFAKYKKVVVVEMNDGGVYGYGQLAMLLRASLADPKIKSVCKTDGLNFRIREIVTGVEKLMADQ
jgi:2-oxoglutarate/2-oxoacid ferredoxin oxidoreductase subunit alpha